MTDNRNPLMDKQNIHKYDDIIQLPHPVSKTHRQMPIPDRAAQFAPFSALAGHREAVKETADMIAERTE